MANLDSYVLLFRLIENFADWIESSCEDYKIEQPDLDTDPGRVRLCWWKDDTLVASVTFVGSPPRNGVDSRIKAILEISGQEVWKDELVLPGDKWSNEVMKRIAPVI